MRTAPHRDAWRRLALCVGHPDRGAWFSERPQDIRRAMAVCGECPVRVECLGYAIANREDEGIWGGLAPSERRRIRRSLARAS